MRSGHPGHVQDLVEWCELYFQQNFLEAWVVANGGWVSWPSRNFQVIYFILLLFYVYVFSAMNWFIYFSVNCLSMVWLQPSSSMSIGCVVSLRRDWAISTIWLRMGFAKLYQPEKNPLKYSITAAGIEPGHGEDRQWDTFIVQRSYHDWLYIITINSNTKFLFLLTNELF